MDVRMGGWMGGWVDGWMDGWVGYDILSLSNFFIFKHDNKQLKVIRKKCLTFCIPLIDKNL